MARRLASWNRVAALVLCCAAGAALTLTRAAWWTPWHGFIRTPATLDSRIAGEAPLVVASFQKALIPTPRWRPLRLVLESRALDVARTLTIESPADGARVDRLVEPGRSERFEIVLRAPGERDGRVALHGSVSGGLVPGGGVTLSAVGATPVITVAALARHALTGVLAGGVFWGLLVAWPFLVRPRLGTRPRSLSPVPVPDTRSVAAAAVVGLGLTVLALLKPPLQTPDEPQHIMRATSVRLAPWVGGVQHFDVDNRHRITLAWGPSPILDGLIGRPDRHLTRAEVTTLTQFPPVTFTDATRVASAIASYPPLFYWYVFGAARLAESTSLTPWQTLYVLRFAVIVPAAVLWGAAFAALRADLRTRRRAPAALALMAGMPMYMHLGSSVNPDAVVVPLGAWLAILCWQGLDRGRARVRSILPIALALLLIKPSGLQVVGALACATAFFAWRRRDARAEGIEIARALAGALAISWAVFYAWSPPSLSDGHGITRTAWQYLRELAGRVPDLWVMFWGKLGWLDYQAPAVFYVALTAVVLAVLAWGWRQGPSADGAGVFFGVYALLIVASTVAGEFVNLPRTGYMLQGRYFLPVAVGVVPITARLPDALRIACLGSVAALQAALAWLTFVRYWNADLIVWLASLPF